ncbi:molecular chaperone [Pseudomonas plecoglossicida]|uniref:molecular chaperone n=1 Tax=Pseudomonas plecoglossicida TaxID=70775 RepID=UPI003977BD35
MQISRLLIMLALLPLTAQAGPQLNVGGLYDYLEAGKTTLAKRIYNSGDSTAFVKVSVLELVYDGEGKPKEVEIEHLPLEQRGVVASPARLIIPAQGMQSVRLLYRGERDTERYFRLRFMPVLPDKDDRFALSETQIEQYRETLSAGVQFLAGYGTLLFTRPNDTRYQTSMRQAGGQLRVGNEGNATVLLDNFRHCQAAGQACSEPVKHHLRPGVAREFAEQPGWEYRFELHEGATHEALTFKAP